MQEKRRKKIENDARRRAERAAEEALLRRQEAEKEESLREEEEKDRKEEERRLASEEEEENERRLEAAAAKVLERQKRLEGGTDVTVEEEEIAVTMVQKEEEKTLEAVRAQMSMVLVEGEAEMSDKEAVAGIVAAEYVKQLAISVNQKTEIMEENGTTKDDKMREPNSEECEVERKGPLEIISLNTEDSNLAQPDLIEKHRDPELDSTGSGETGRDSTGSDLELGSKEAVTAVSKPGSMQIKETEEGAENIGDQRSTESHINVSLEKDDGTGKPNVQEIPEENRSLEKTIDKSEIHASEHPEAENAVCRGSEKKVAKQVLINGAQDDVVSGGQMSSNGASADVSREGETLREVSEVNRCEPAPTSTSPACNSLPEPVETVENQTDSSLISQGEQDNIFNSNQSAAVDIITHPKDSPASSSIQNVPPPSIQNVSDKLINGHKSTAADDQTEEKGKLVSKTTCDCESSQPVSSTNDSGATSPSKPSSLMPTDTLAELKSTLVSLEERLATCGLPEAVEDAEFDNKLKVVAANNIISINHHRDNDHIEGVHQLPQLWCNVPKQEQLQESRMGFQEWNQAGCELIECQNHPHVTKPNYLL